MKYPIKSLFILRGNLSKKVNLTIMIIGFIFILFVWSIITGLNLIPTSLLPTPWSVIASFKELHFEDALIRNTIFSLKLNILGYIEAIIIAIPIGFIIGLFPLFRESFKKTLDSFRFIPLSAVTGLFIAWFGIGNDMKIHFLAFGIIVYLLPVVAQRIFEVDEVYTQTAATLGARDWQVITSVFVPGALSRVIDDIRVLTAISWTYIIIAELLNKTEGIGALAYTAARQSRIDKVFAVLVVIIIIGIVQDKLFMLLDKTLFPFKYASKEKIS